MQSHLLIAVVPTDEHPRQEADTDGSPITQDVFTGNPHVDELNAGSAAIVNVKRNGITPGLLVDNPAFLWTSAGPTVVVRYPASWHDKCDPSAAASDEAETERRVAAWMDELTVEVIYPADADESQSRDTYLRLVRSMTELQQLDDERSAAIAPKTPGRIAAAWTALKKFIAPPRRPEAAADETPSVRTPEQLLLDQLAGNRLLTDFSFGTESVNCSRKPEAVVGDLLSETQTFNGRCRETILNRLGQMVRIRNIASGVSGDQSARHTKLLLRLFLLTTLAAVCVHLGSHWHVESPNPGQHTNSSVQHDGDDDAKSAIRSGQEADAGHPDLPDADEPQGHGDHHHIAATLWLTAGIVCFFSAIVLFHKYRAGPAERHRFDFRALAEGLRVQVFWIVAGLNDSVAAGYMQRQRGEVDWFRRVLSSLTAPYERWPEWFRSLQDEGRRDALELVTHVFIGQQLEYSSNSYRLQELHSLHVKGNSTALAGVALTMLSALLMAIPWQPRPEYDAFSAAALCLGFLWVVKVTLWCIAIFRIRYPRNRPLTFVPHGHGPGTYEDLDLLPEKHHRHEPWLPAKLLRGESRNTWKSLQAQFAAARRWTWTMPAHVTIPQARYVLTSAWLIAQAICIAVMLSGLAVEGTVSLPGFNVWITLTAGIYLLVGAMSVARAEKLGLSEHRMQYNAMATMHQAAFRRLLGHLAELNRLLEAKRTVVTSTSQTGSRDGELQALQGKIDTRIAAMQQLIRDAGLQALDENAEWLILHRARPMEPVMAG